MYSTSNSTPSKENILLLCTHAATQTRRKLQLEQNGFSVQPVGWNEKEQIDFRPEVSAVLVENEIPDNPQLLPLCEHIRTRSPDVPILVTDLAGSEKGDSLLKFTPNYFARPSDKQLLAILDQAIQLFRLKYDSRMLYRHLGLIPSSISVSDDTPLKKRIEERGRTDETVVIFGERGTGKTTVAQLIHQASRRADHPYFVVPCHSIPDAILDAGLVGKIVSGVEYHGRLSICNRGTILLDNVDYLSPKLQKKLAEFLKTRTYRPIGSKTDRTSEVRVIVSMQQSVGESFEAGFLTRSLFAQLFSRPLVMPPLAKRIDDLPHLCGDFLARMTERPLTISAEAMAKMEKHLWPGNLHELESVVGRAIRKAKNGVVRDCDVTFDHAYARKRRNGVSLGLAGMTVVEVECRLINETLEFCHGNRTQAARILDISTRTLYNKIKKYGLPW